LTTDGSKVSAYGNLTACIFCKKTYWNRNCVWLWLKLPGIKLPYFLDHLLPPRPPPSPPSPPPTHTHTHTATNLTTASTTRVTHAWWPLTFSQKPKLQNKERQFVNTSSIYTFKKAKEQKALHKSLP
jgi:hypothetical protein